MASTEIIQIRIIHDMHITPSKIEPGMFCIPKGDLEKLTKITINLFDMLTEKYRDEVYNYITNQRYGITGFDGG